MKAAALYLFTAIATGIHAFYLEVWTVNLAPNPLHYISFAGSVILLGAAFTAPFRDRKAAIVATIGSFLLWCFYAPALVLTFLTFLSRGNFWSTVQFYGYIPLFGAVICPVLLTLTTIYVIRHVKRRRAS
jgi:hypothetical protein